MRGIDILPLSTNYLLDFGNVPREWCFLFFILFAPKILWILLHFDSHEDHLFFCDAYMVMVMVFNATFNDISAKISHRPVLLVGKPEKTTDLQHVLVSDEYTIMVVNYGSQLQPFIVHDIEVFIVMLYIYLQRMHINLLFFFFFFNNCMSTFAFPPETYIFME